MLQIFKKHGEENSRNRENQFWINGNHPEECYTQRFTEQKLNYTHQNPVKAAIVANAWDYLYSSARDYHEERKCGLLEVTFI